MKFKSLIIAALAAVLSWPASAQQNLLPNPELCFSALGPTSGGPGGTGTGYIGLLGTITGGTLYTNGTYAGVSLTGGSGSGATANITVSGGSVIAVSILNPGANYVVGDTLSASAASLGGTGSGFSVPVSSVAINFALAGGAAAFYIPNTLTPKQTYQNQAGTVLNSNPVTLDQNGCALVWGAGSYRVILKDSLGNTVFDQITSVAQSSIFWAGNAAGSPNSITVTDTSFANQDGSTIQFRALYENTGPTTIAVSGGAAINVVKDTSTGPAALSGGEIGPNNTPMVTYDATNSEFHLVNPSATSGSSGSTASLVTPQGYLNLVGQASGNVVQTGDVVAATTIYYSPFVGSIVPIFNGTTFVNTQISELTATLTSAGSPSNTIQDACVFSNNGVPTLVLGPSWTTVTAGSGSRGTGAGTAQLSRLDGLWVNAVSITGYNGLSSYSIPASQCTYVGSVYIDVTAGQVSAYRTWGQNRKFGVWNAYNRQPITLLAGDPTSFWTYTGGSFRASNNNPSAYSSTVCNAGSGTACNGAVVFQGLSEEAVSIQFLQQTQPSGSSTGSSIGWNSITAASGVTGVLNTTGAASVVSNAIATYQAAPFLGIANAISLESGNASTPTFSGSSTHMQLTAQWRG